MNSELLKMSMFKPQLFLTTKNTKTVADQGFPVGGGVECLDLLLVTVLCLMFMMAKWSSFPPSTHEAGI